MSGGIFGVAEIKDSVGSDPEHHNGNVATAGVPVTVSPTGGAGFKVVMALVRNPGSGPNQNPANRVLLLSIDGTINYLSLARGEMVALPGNFNNIKIDASNNNTNFELIFWVTSES